MPPRVVGSVVLFLRVRGLSRSHRPFSFSAGEAAFGVAKIDRVSIAGVRGMVGVAVTGSDEESGGKDVLASPSSGWEICDLAWSPKDLYRFTPTDPVDSFLKGHGVRPAAESNRGIVRAAVGSNRGGISPWVSRRARWISRFKYASSCFFCLASWRSRFFRSRFSGFLRNCRHS